MATFDLGRVAPIYKGAYDASTAYELNDIVLYSGKLYWHTLATATTGVLPTDTDTWTVAFDDGDVRSDITGLAASAEQSASAASASATAASASEASAATSETNASASETAAAASAESAAESATNAQQYAESASAYLMTDAEATNLLSIAIGGE